MCRSCSSSLPLPTPRPHSTYLTVLLTQALYFIPHCRIVKISTGPSSPSLPLPLGGKPNTRPFTNFVKEGERKQAHAIKRSVFIVLAGRCFSFTKKNVPNFFRSPQTVPSPQRPRRPAASEIRASRRWINTTRLENDEKKEKGCTSSGNPKIRRKKTHVRAAGAHLLSASSTFSSYLKLLGSSTRSRWVVLSDVTATDERG